jgi:hypothetical protein
VLVAERITEEGNDPDLNKFLDIAMLAITGGIERTERQFAKLFAQAGLRLARHPDRCRNIDPRGSTAA